MGALVPVGASALVPTNMDEAIRMAKAMADAKLVPKHLQGDVGSCLMIVEQAMRWNMSPFAVAQCTSSIGGKLMFEGKLVAAAVESSGAIEGHFNFDYTGDGAERQVTVRARRPGEANDRQLTIKLKDVKTSNQWWEKQPDQQLAYSGVRNWARRYTPAALLGVYSPEEIDRSTGKTIDGDPVIDNEPKAKPAYVPPEGTYVPPKPQAPQRPSAAWEDWLQKLRWNLSGRSPDEIAEIYGRQGVRDNLEHAPDWVKEDAKQIAADAYEQAQARADDKAEAEAPFPGIAPGLGIEGEDKAAAG